MKFLTTIALSFLFFVAIGQDYTEVDAHAYSIGYSKSYKTVAQKLVKPFEKDEAKARAIFTWIAKFLRYDYEKLDKIKKKPKRDRRKISYRTEEERIQLERKMIEEELETFLSKRKGVCEDYAKLYKAMCDEVGLECVFISGFGRFSPNNIGKVHQRSNHAWNAVKLDGEWTLLDVTWSTGMGKKEDYGNGFFKVAPETFILSHHPSEDQWQLLNEPITKEVFSNVAFPYYGMIKYQGELVHSLEGTRSKKDKLSVRLNIEEGQRVYLIRSKKVTKLKPIQEDDVFTFDLSKIKVRGDVTIGVSNNGSIEPVVGFKVR